jgi:HAD superfamily hydrolase (TIGR01509 family)
MVRGILFDIDGTLVLSNDAHAAAWEEAFASYGYEVPYHELRELIGMGSDKLIRAVKPELNDEEGDGRKIKELRAKIFLKKYVPTLEPTPGSRELVSELQSQGLKTVVATSAKRQELGPLLEKAGVEDLLTDATSSDDAENSKPDPDIVAAALDKLSLPAGDVLMIGDTPYDIEAAEKAGVACVALRTGGWQDADLHGAVAVFDDPSELCQRISEVLAVANR